jgi:glutamate formiminotransferase / formiminotetrahydrofolate cyclodeaminase
MAQIVECVPNFSEGRRPEVLDEIVEAMRGVPGVLVLDREMDANHNRAVVTIAGAPSAVSEAAFRGIAAAADRIDLRTHTGEHPRMGATDVVPFIPIEGVTMDDCALLARALGERVGRELSIPVFLYEAAATRADRENLADVRRGEFEGLRDEIGKNPDRAPDFGPAAIHASAGATAIGARMPLVAYNINLATRDVSVAKKVANAVRFQRGGLRYVKAMGFELADRGLSQVSMNLVNTKGTPIHRVFTMVEREAARYGVSVVGSEVVGLVPEEALIDSADFFLKLENFHKGQILENRLREAQEARSESKEDFLDRLAGSSPTPGGGSVAALAGALGAALVSMVAALTVGKKKYAEVEEAIKETRKSSESLRSKLTRLIEQDVEAFDAVMRAFKLPRASEAEERARAVAVEKALMDASQVPLETVERALEVLDLARHAAQVGNVNAVSDAGVAAYMCEAAARSAALNVRINAKGLTNDEARRDLTDRVERLLESVRRKTSEIEAIVGNKL